MMLKLILGGTDVDAAMVKKEVWRRYLEEFRQRVQQTLSYTRFVECWNNCFPHVRIREQSSKLFHTHCFDT